LPSPHTYIYWIVREVPGRQQEVQLMRGGPTKGTPKTAILTILAFQFVREPTAFIYRSENKKHKAEKFEKN
jgi:hypothetical protein